MSLIFDVNEDDFAERVVARSLERPVLVDFSAEWCAPCRVLTPLLERAVRDADGDVLLAIVDAEENMRIAGRHKVRGFPTVVAYSRGVEVARFQSAQAATFLRGFIDDLVGRHERNEPTAASG